MYRQEDFEKAIKLLEENNQASTIHILKKVNGEVKEKLINQILNLDFENINKLYNITKEKPAILNKEIKPIEHVDERKLEAVQKEAYIKLGEGVIKSGNYAVVTMAGGQGTRLDHNGPKGSFKIKVNSEDKYLFQILAENIEKENEKYGITLPWYIMTSTENNKATINFFEEHNYFNYPKEKIKFFTQGNLPLLLTNGQLVIDKNYEIKEAADGNGCIYKAMRDNGILEDMKAKNIKWIFIGAVDNILLNMVDPLLLGLAISQNNIVASKSIAKRSPQERVGVFCRAGGVPSVIEYSELPEDIASKTDDDGELLYGEAHIMCNLFTLEALEKISNYNMPYHIAQKKSEYVDKNGRLIKPEIPNVYKFEAFIFDAFNLFDNISILRGKREEEFAPVKNKEGNDSPVTAAELYNNYWKNKQ